VRQIRSQARELPGRPTLRSTSLAAATLVTLLAANSASAVEIDTGLPDLSVRWDNTFRYNYAMRAEGRDPKIGNTLVADEGDWRFDNGSTVANRFDLLSELDVVYDKRFGARASGQAWYDAAYDSHSRTNPNTTPLPYPLIGSYVNNEYSGYTKHLYDGPGAELLDAFVFAGADVGNVPVQVKVGRHSIYWGESLLLGGNLHSIAYAQNPLDLQKGYATPGVEAKELFRPLGQISASAQLTDTVSLAGQYLFQWESDRFPEGGTYLGPVDFAFNGPERQLLAVVPGVGPVFATNGGQAPTQNHGDYGLALRWTPAALDATIGAYYRNFTDKIPQALITQAPTGPAVGPYRYNLIYASDISLFGLSFSKNIAGVSVGSELSYRHNTPLNAKVLGMDPVGLPAAGDTNGPRGDTMHGLVNAVGVIPQNPVFDTASWVTELTWSRLMDVTSGANLFNGLGYAPCMPSAAHPAAYDKWDGCSTKTFVGLGAGFTPTWFAVAPGVDLQMPLTYSVGLSGNAATVFGGNEGAGNYTVGLSADVWQKYHFDLKYVDFLGHYKDNGYSVTAANGFNTYLKDRGFVSLTFKTTF
jgi:hypothetical protein